MTTKKTTTKTTKPKAKTTAVKKKPVAKTVKAVVVDQPLVLTENPVVVEQPVVVTQTPEVSDEVKKLAGDIRKDMIAINHWLAKVGKISLRKKVGLALLSVVIAIFGLK